MSGRTRIAGARAMLCGYGAYALLGSTRFTSRLLAPACPFRVLTGRPCPACGLTRAVAATLRGHSRQAAALHRLGPPVAVAVLVAAATTAAAVTTAAAATTAAVARVAPVPPTPVASATTTAEVTGGRRPVRPPPPPPRIPR